MPTQLKTVQDWDRLAEPMLQCGQGLPCALCERIEWNPFR